jgi:hypothetical protein
MLLARRRPTWATPAQRVEFNRIGCRIYPRACEAITAIARDASLARAVRDTAWKAAERGCRRWSETCYTLGRAHLRARPKAARRWWTVGCKGKDARACGELAWRLQRGDGLPKDRAGARWARDRACRAGDQRLCEERLAHQQARGAYRAIARQCTQGDALSCAAQHVRRCRRGDTGACRKAMQPPPGACALGPVQCTGPGPYLPDRCAPYDPCLSIPGTLRKAARAAFMRAAQACSADRVQIHLVIARSGEAVEWTMHRAGEAEDCLIRHIKALRLPPAQVPTNLTISTRQRPGRTQTDEPRFWVRARVRLRRGTPLPPISPGPFGLDQRVQQFPLR